MSISIATETRPATLRDAVEIILQAIESGEHQEARAIEGGSPGPDVPADGVALLLHVPGGGYSRSNIVAELRNLAERNSVRAHITDARTGEHLW